MGLYSVMSHATSKMTREDPTNSRTHSQWIKRVLGIAQDLERSHDIAKSVSIIAYIFLLDQLFCPRQQKLETVVADVAERFTSTETNQDESTFQITPKIYRKRKEILTEADKTLDSIQVRAVSIALTTALMIQY